MSQRRRASSTQHHPENADAMCVGVLPTSCNGFRLRGANHSPARFPTEPGHTPCDRKKKGHRQRQCQHHLQQQCSIAPLRSTTIAAWTPPFRTLPSDKTGQRDMKQRRDRTRIIGTKHFHSRIASWAESCHCKAWKAPPASSERLGVHEVRGTALQIGAPGFRREECEQSTRSANDEIGTLNRCRPAIQSQGAEANGVESLSGLTGLAHVRFASRKPKWGGAATLAVQPLRPSGHLESAMLLDEN